MSNITVAEILKIHGKWVKSSEFAELVSEKKKVSERHAYNLIKKAWKNREILKVSLSDRTVLYGLPEFGVSSTEEPSEINYDRLRFLIENKIVNPELAETLLDIEALETVKPEFKKDEEFQLLKKVVQILSDFC